jgi:hypothetical protein
MTLLNSAHAETNIHRHSENTRLRLLAGQREESSRWRWVSTPEGSCRSICHISRSTDLANLSGRGCERIAGASFQTRIFEDAWGTHSTAREHCLNRTPRQARTGPHDSGKHHTRFPKSGHHTCVSYRTGPSSGRSDTKTDATDLGSVCRVRENHAGREATSSEGTRCHKDRTLCWSEAVWSRSGREECYCSNHYTARSRAGIRPNSGQVER